MANEDTPEPKTSLDELFVDQAGRARVWPVFSVYLAAFVAIVAVAGVAATMVTSMYPDVAPEHILRTLAGSAASSVGLILTLFFATRSFAPASLRLLPGRETGRQLFVMVLGVLALGQALDSLTVIAGLHRAGSMAWIRRALAGAAGENLFAAVLVFGLISGTAEEVFFRGFMQTRLRACWSPPVAVLVTSACFGVMHLEWVLGVLAFLLALYLGFITELSGSALPAIACHVIHNALVSVLTAAIGPVESLGASVVLFSVAAAVLVGCVFWLRRRLPTPAQ